MMARPWLVNLTANWASATALSAWMWISLMYIDLDVRKKALNPLFWLKMLLGKVDGAIGETVLIF
ncbi:MAG: hypothetical protein R2825_18905 [Saprospiraceae bacterium]